MENASNPVVASFVMCSGVMLLTNTTYMVKTTANRYELWTNRL